MEDIKEIEKSQDEESIKSIYSQITLIDLLLLENIKILSSIKDDGMFDTAEFVKVVNKDCDVVDEDGVKLFKGTYNYFYKLLSSYVDLGLLEKTTEGNRLRFKTTDVFDEHRYKAIASTKNVLEFLKDVPSSKTKDEIVKEKLCNLKSLELITILDNVKDELNRRDEGVLIDVVKTMR